MGAMVTLALSMLGLFTDGGGINGVGQSGATGGGSADLDERERKHGAQIKHPNTLGRPTNVGPIRGEENLDELCLGAYTPS